MLELTKDEHLGKWCDAVGMRDIHVEYHEYSISLLSSRENTT